MKKKNNRLPKFIIYCVLFAGGLYEIFLTGNFTNYSTSGKIKSIILMILITLLIVLHLFRDKSKDNFYDDE